MVTVSPYMTGDEAAELAGIAPGTFRKYVSDGQAPRPIVAGRGIYDRAEVLHWIANRPGRGHRTDMHGRTW